MLRARIMLVSALTTLVAAGAGFAQAVPDTGASGFKFVPALQIGPRSGLHVPTKITRHYGVVQRSLPYSDPAAEPRVHQVGGVKLVFKGHKFKGHHGYVYKKHKPRRVHKRHGFHAPKKHVHRPFPHHRRHGGFHLKYKKKFYKLR